MKQPKDQLSIGFLYDDTLDKFDGVSQYVKTLGSWLSSRGHQVSYLVGETNSTDWRGGAVYSLSKNLNVAWGGNRLSVPIVPNIKAINRLLASKKFDVLHVQVPYSPLMSQLVINRIGADTAVVGTVHIFTSGRLSLAGSKMLKIIYGRSLKRFDKFLSVSPAAQKYAAEALKQKSQISPNVIDLKRIKRANKQKKGQAKSIVFLGRLVERKGCAYLLQAFKILQSLLPEARLTVAGDGPQRTKLESLTATLGIKSSVRLLGKVDEEQKIAVLAEADIACFPSLYGESFGIVLLEAMGAGAKVVIGGDNEGYRSVLGEQPDLLVDPRDTEKFAAQLTNFLQNQHLISRVSQWQKKTVQVYDVARVGPSIETIYRQAIANRAKSRHN